MPPFPVRGFLVFAVHCTPVLALALSRVGLRATSLSGVGSAGNGPESGNSSLLSSQHNASSGNAHGTTSGSAEHAEANLTEAQGHALAGEQLRMDNVDPRSICGGDFDPCWDGAAWKASPACSGVPSTWDAVLLSPGLEETCAEGREPPIGSPSCSKLPGMCQARDRLFRRNCTTSAGIRTIRSGDVVFLQAHSGMHFDSDGGHLRARWPEQGLWESFVVETEFEGPLTSGDQLLLRTHDGHYVSHHGSNITAATGPPNATQRLTIERDGGGDILTGNAIYLKLHSGKFIGIEGESVEAHEAKPGNQQILRIHKEMNWQNASAFNFGGTCEKPAPSPREVHAGSTVFLRASNGKLIDVIDNKVQARWKEFGGWQKLMLEKDGQSDVASGDVVFLKTHEGTHIDAEGTSVQARMNGHGTLQEMRLEKKEGGAIHFGDRVRLVTSDGRNITVRNESVHASVEADVEAQEFIVEKGTWTETLNFLHIPKNAGTAIEDAAWSKGISWGQRAMPDAVKMENNDFCAAHSAPPSRLPKPEQEKYMNLENVCVTRHPYDRALSEYVYRLYKENNQTHEDDLFKFPQCSEEGLNHYLQAHLRRNLDGVGRFALGCHLVPQTSYIWDQDRQWCAHILRVEDLPGAFNELMEEKGYPVRLGDDVHNKTNSHLALCPHLSVKSFSNDTKALLNTVYAADFRRLGYSVNH